MPEPATALLSLIPNQFRNDMVDRLALHDEDEATTRVSGRRIDLICLSSSSNLTMDKLSKAQRDEFATAFAILALYDGGVSVSSRRSVDGIHSACQCVGQHAC